MRRALLAAVLLGLVTSCSSAGHSTNAVGVIAHSGRVPIPTAPASAAPVTATPGHPQLLAMGAPVYVVLNDQAGIVTALGPDVSAVPGARDLATGTITITAPVLLSPRADEFTCRDETGRDVPLTPVTSSVQAPPGTLHLAGTFHAGASEITWRVNGAVVALWDFNVELD